MMKVLCVFAACVVAFVACTDVASELSKDEFDGRDTNVAYFVKFYAPW